MNIFSKILLLLLLLGSFTTNTNAQHFMRGVCGVHAHDMELMEKLYPHDKMGIISGDRNATIHIPVQFHLVATNTGSGRIPPHIVLKQLCKLNHDFSNTPFRFYIYADFLHIDNSLIYNTPGTNANSVQQKKVSKALNIFITDKADVDGALGTVLGYYSPQGDYVVLTKAEAVKLSNTLSHEIGHFLSLRHTFHGWENDPWDKSRHSDTIKLRYTQSNNEIEFMNKTNCINAADQLCDTPPDYNFGFTSSGCNYTYDVWDYNQEKVITQKDNQMGYFSNCSEYQFTPNQSSRMMINYNSTVRNYLKNQPLPKLDTVVGPPTLISPNSGEQLNVFDGVLFDWEDVPNATHYVLEIRNLSANEYLIVTKSEYYATNLKKNLQYTYEVTPFSFGSFCATSSSATFKTGTLSTTSIDDINSKLKMAIYPNPVDRDNAITIQFETVESMEFNLQLLDMHGKQVYHEKLETSTGKQYHKINTKGSMSGIYFLQVDSNHTNQFFKVIIQ
ncbi:MAG: zinc-dependent metalloprotease [Saprospiraceae bacterium]